MAKINIPFNNVTYSIEESALADATAALKSHLQTVMNGSGATVTLGGISYNVDSTKLTTAKNAFVSHLGTIAGSGSKVVVNGVAYSISSDKIQSTVSNLHTVFGGLQSGGGNTGDGVVEEYEVIPMTTLGGFHYSTQWGIYLISGQFPCVATVGEIYHVVWDGVEYECVGQDASAMLPGAVCIGNGTGWGFSGKNEPFVMAADNAGGVSIGVFTEADANKSHTVRIYTTIRPSDSTKIPVLPEMIINIRDTQPYTTNNLEVSFELTPDEEYTVVFDGVEYVCVAQDISSVWGGAMDAGMQVALGDMTKRNFAGNNEPFAISVMTQEAAQKFAFGTTPIMAVEVFDSANVGTHTVAIYK